MSHALYLVIFDADKNSESNSKSTLSMKNNLNRLKKWLFSYFVISILLFAFDFLWSYTGKISLKSSISSTLIINAFYFIITFFFYLKVTKKPIGWSLTTILLAYFLSALLALFLTTLINSSRSSFVDYVLFSFSGIFFNILFMFAGVFSEKKTPIKHWEDDILDDISS